MIDAPEIGAVYLYAAKGGFGNRRVPVKVIGFRGASWVITQGVEDKRRRDVPRSRLERENGGQ